MAAAVQKIIIHADDQTGAAIASAIRNSQKLEKQMNRTATATRTMTRQSRAQMAQVGHQVQDIAVQLQMGMNPLMVLGQQGSQLASIFGAKGALFGGLVAIAGAIGGVLFSSLKAGSAAAGEFADNMIKAAGGVEKLNEAQRALVLGDMSSKLKEMQEELAETTRLSKAEIDSLFDVIKGRRFADGDLGLFDRITALFADPEDFEKQLAVLKAEIGLTEDQILKIRQAAFKKTEAFEKIVADAGVARVKTAREEREKIEKKADKARDFQERMRLKGNTMRFNKIVADAKAAAAQQVQIEKEAAQAIAKANAKAEEIRIRNATTRFNEIVKLRDERIEKEEEAAKKAEKLQEQMRSRQLAAMKAHVSETEKLLDSLDASTERVLGSMEDGMVGLIKGTTSVKDAFKNMAASIIDDLIRMQIQSTITRPLAGFLGTALSGFALGGDAARVTTGQGGMGPAMSGPASLRANGGPVSRGRAYMVGERGPELMIPRGGGTVVPNSHLGGEAPVSVTLNVSTGVAQTVRTEIATMMPEISNAVKAAVVDARRRGGSFAGAFGA